MFGLIAGLVTSLHPLYADMGSVIRVVCGVCMGCGKGPSGCSSIAC